MGDLLPQYPWSGLKGSSCGVRGLVSPLKSGILPVKPTLTYCTKKGEYEI
jgi:hypothetical protein